MHASVVPGFGDLAGLVTFVFRDPHLFVSSSTVMTTGIIAVLALLSLPPLRVAPVHRLLVRSAAPLALVFAYFGLGSLALSLDPRSIPRRHPERDRDSVLLADAIALLYWALQIVILDPPWFSFQGQAQLMRTAAFAAIVGVAFATAVAGRMTVRS
jgi:hypothetical protein